MECIPPYNTVYSNVLLNIVIVSWKKYLYLCTLHAVITESFVTQGRQSCLTTQSLDIFFVSERGTSAFVQALKTQNSWRHIDSSHPSMTACSYQHFSSVYVPFASEEFAGRLNNKGP